MGKGRRKSKFDKIRDRSWRFYSNWRKTGSKCPAFQNEVIHISRFGWNHLLDSRKHRTTADTIRRLEAIPLAKKLLETATTVQEFRKDKGISYWAFTALLDGKRIKVVVSAKNTKKYFLSVIVYR